MTAQSDARRAYAMSKKTKKAVADREAAKVKPEPAKKAAPKPKVDKDE